MIEFYKRHRDTINQVIDIGYEVSRCLLAVALLVVVLKDR